MAEVCMRLLKKASPSSYSPADVPTDLLEEGRKVEMEHTDDEEVARCIAADHIMKEGKEYYAGLKKMEAKLK